MLMRRLQPVHFVQLSATLQSSISSPAACACAQLRNFNSLRGISLAAAVMALGYSTIATGDLRHVLRRPTYEEPALKSI